MRSTARHSLTPDELAMVGDRLYTDMAMAKSIGALGVLVLTGEATADEAAACPNPPNLIVDDLTAFGRLLNKEWMRNHG
ncbi:MAG: HAD hydrolase-like protein [Pirellulales bacterium]|nr:HAD hydrolase-like protein [Pirellulales bacterium]